MAGTQSVSVNPFSVYASTVDYNAPSCEIKSIILNNIKIIAQNALTVGYIDGSKQQAIVPPSLDMKTLRFFTPATVSPLGYITSFLPVGVSSALGYGPTDTSAKNIQDFFEFMTSSVSDVAQLQVGEGAEQTSLATYLLKQYEKLHFGLAYLEQSYRSSNRNKDSDYVRGANKTLDCAVACCGVIENLTSDQQHHYTRSFISINEAYPVLEYQRYAPLKKILDLPGKWSFMQEKTKVERKLKSNYREFFSACLRMKEAELKEVCQKFEGMLTGNDKSVSKTDQFFTELLKNKYFASIHTFCITKLLRKKKSLETQEHFDHRAQTNLALEYVKTKINEIKITPEKDREQQLISFLRNHSDINLVYYKPFLDIFNFVFHHFDTPEIAGYCALPFKAIGQQDFLTFVAKVLLSVDDINTIDGTTRKTRLVLLQCSEFLFLRPGNKEDFIDKEKLRNWLCQFPEVSEFPAILSVTNLSTL